ncbi:MAG: hypothetical protein ACPGVV_11435 [Croceimicrobium sp.]
MNDLTVQKTALEVLGVDLSQLEEIKEPDLRVNAEARTGYPIQSVKGSDIKVFLADQVEQILINLGQKDTAKGVIPSIVDTFGSTLNQFYYSWTREEIAQAWRLGSMGKLGGGEIHLSARNLSVWLDQYNEQHRKPTYRKLKRLSALNITKGVSEPKLKEMTTEAKREALNEALKDRGLIKKAPKHYYNMLASLGFCKISDAAETWDLIGKANVDLLQEIKSLQGFSMDEAKNRKHKITSIRREDPSTVPEFVKNRAKQIKVLQYFETLPDNFKF